MSKVTKIVRTPGQIEYSQKRVAELTMQAVSQSQMAEIISDELGISVSKYMIRHDMAAVRKEWAETKRTSANEVLAQELFRIDILWNEAWKNYRQCMIDDDEIVELEEFLSLGEDDYIEARRKTTQIKNSKMALAWFDRIISLDKERRRLLDVYGATKIAISSQSVVRKEVVTKAYVNLQEWPQQGTTGQIVDGQFVPLIEDGQQADS